MGFQFMEMHLNLKKMQNQFLEMNFYKSENEFSKIKNPFAKLRKCIFFVRIKWPYYIY
jgi:hypothetical protein